MLEGKHYQNAFVTRNADKWIEEFRKKASVPQDKITTYDGPVTWKTAKGEGEARSKLVFIWINNLQYELIQPISGLVDIYRDALPADDSLKFHHICMRIPNWENFRARVEKQRYPVVLEGGGEHLRFLYLDARDFLGHYLEYVWCTQERWEMMTPPEAR